MSTISTGTTLTTALVQTGDTTGNLVIKTGSSNTTAMTISGSDQSVGIGTSSPNIGGYNTALTVNNATSTALPGIELATAGVLGASIFYNGNTNVAYFGGQKASSQTVLTSAGTEKMRLDASGNLGLGVTPSAWATFKAAQVNYGSLASTSGNNTVVASNAYYDGAWKFISTGTASSYNQDNTDNYWRIATGTAGGTISWTTTLASRLYGSVLGIGGYTSQTTDWGYGGAGAVQIYRSSLYSRFGINTVLADNLYMSNDTLGQEAYITNGAASFYTQTNGAHAWGNAPSGTAGNAATLTSLMAVSSTGLFQFNSGYGSVATAYGCRAWVKFTGTGTPGVSASGNVSSITDNGTGYYGVNFSTAMPDANYSVVGCIKPTTGQTGNNARAVNVHWNSGQQTSYVNVVTATSSAGYEDPEFVYIAVFR